MPCGRMLLVLAAMMVSVEPGLVTSSVIGERCANDLPAIGMANPSFEADETQNYTYTVPEGWALRGDGELGPTGRVGVIVVRNGNTAWGGLDSGSGSYYIALQRANTSIQQTVSGLLPLRQYILSFKAAERPGYGDEERLTVIVDGQEVAKTLDPFGDFAVHHVEFTASGGTAVIQFVNRSPPSADRSVFIDDVSLCPVARGCLVVPNGGFENNAHGADFVYQHPDQWVGVQHGSVVAANNNAPWGRLDSGDGAYYLVLQSHGAGVQQQIHGLSPGAEYSVQFLAAERPQYGSEERLSVYINNLPLPGGVDIDVQDNFTAYALNFTAAARNLLFFENTSPAGQDLSVFIDAVQICEIAPSATVGFQYVHDGHCNAGYIRNEGNVATVEACASRCMNQEGCGYFAYATSIQFCGLYLGAEGCPDDNSYGEYDSYALNITEIARSIEPSTISGSDNSPDENGVPVWTVVLLAVGLLGLAGYIFRGRISQAGKIKYSIMADTVEMTSTNNVSGSNCSEDDDDVLDIEPSAMSD